MNHSNDVELARRNVRNRNCSVKLELNSTSAVKLDFTELNDPSKHYKPVQKGFIAVQVRRTGLYVISKQILKMHVHVYFCLQKQTTMLKEPEE